MGVATEVDDGIGHVGADEFLTIDEVARLLRKSKGTIYQYTSKGLIPFYKFGNRLLFRRSEILELLASCKRV